MPLTTIARQAGTSVAMIDKHYAGVIANWDGRPVLAEVQIARAREQLALGETGGRSVDVCVAGKASSLVPVKPCYECLSP